MSELIVRPNLRRSILAVYSLLPALVGVGIAVAVRGVAAVLLLTIVAAELICAWLYSYVAQFRFSSSSLTFRGLLGRARTWPADDISAVRQSATRLMVQGSNGRTLLGVAIAGWDVDQLRAGFHAIGKDVVT